MTHRLIVGGELLLYGDVGDMWGDGTGFTGADVVTALAELGPGPITVRLNSGGGFVTDGVAIFNALKNHRGDITVFIDAMAASAASVIAMAGSRIVMREGSMMMIHDPQGFTMGTAEDHQDTADVLNKMGDVIAAIYANRTGRDAKDIRAMMLAETWLDAEEAVVQGFANEAEKAPAVTASAFDYALYKKTPEIVMQAPQKKRPAQPEASASNRKDLGMKTPEELEAEKTAAAKLAADKLEADRIALAAKPPPVDVTREIMKRCRAANLSLGETDVIVDKALGDVNKAKDLIIDLIAARDKDSEIVPPNVKLLADSMAKFKQGAERALMERAGIKGGERNEFSSLTLRELARHTLLLSGVKMNFDDPMKMVAAAFRPVMVGMHSTSDFVEVLANVANKSMLKGYLEADETFDQWTARGVLTDFKAAKRVDLNLFPSLAVVPEGAEYTSGTMGDRGETIQLATYGKMFAITRQAIINDDMSVFTRVPSRMGRAAKRTVGNLVYAVITDNAAMSDGITLFHADHNNVGTGVPSTTTIDAGRSVMAKQRDPDLNAAALNIRPAFILVPVELQGKVASLMAAEFDPAGTQRNPNIVRNLATVVSDARLSVNSAVKWYMAANPNANDTIEVAYLNGNDQPALEQRDGWNVDGVEFKVRLDAAVKALDFRGLYYSTGA